jgi:hypothetical protein
MSQPPADDEAFPEAALEALARALPERINADPDRVEQGLARLVLTVIELLRRVLEHQAVRRMDGRTLSDEEVERLGLALKRLELEWAARNGIREVVTWTQRGNAGMRAVNERLGYEYRTIAVRMLGPVPVR